MERFIPRAEAALKGDPQFATAVFATSGGCPPLPGINESAPGFQCPAFYDDGMALARQGRFSTVAISANWESYRPNENPLWAQTFHGTARYSGAEIVSPRDCLCNARNCPALDTDGTPIYRDSSNHIRASKAARLATFIDDCTQITRQRESL
jgi:hypothetical protein